jgi:hypothetical protein
MGVRVLTEREFSSTSVLYCSTTEIAFGPLFHDDHGHDSDERAESFLRYLGANDARHYTEAELLSAYQQWRAQEVEQWKKEEEESNMT